MIDCLSDTESPELLDKECQRLKLVTIIDLQNPSGGTHAQAHLQIDWLPT